VMNKSGGDPPRGRERPEHHHLRGPRPPSPRSPNSLSRSAGETTLQQRNRATNRGTDPQADKKGAAEISRTSTYVSPTAWT
jgi:hypothetical protein